MTVCHRGSTQPARTPPLPPPAGSATTPAALPLRSADRVWSDYDREEPALKGSYGKPARDQTWFSTPAAKTSAAERRRQRALPADLLRDASRRLGIMSLVGGGLWTVGSVLGHVAVLSMTHGGPRWLELGGPDAIAAERAGIVAAVHLHAQP